MKKIYIQPTMQIVKVEHQTICAVSEFNQQLGSDGIDGDATLTKDQEDWDLWDE